MSKLSATQQDVIDRMAAGQLLVYEHGVRQSGYFRLASERGAWLYPRGQTIHSLERRGLVKRLPYKNGSFRNEYELTDVGRAAATPGGAGSGG